MQYELFYLVGESKEPDLEKIKEEIKNAVIQEGGNFLELQVTEKRKLAYKIKGESRGTYVAQRFEIEDDKDTEGSEEKNQISNITKKLNLNQNIFRFIIIKSDELPELKTREKAAKRRDRKEERIFETKEVKKEKKKPEVPKDIDEKLEEILKI